MIFITYATKFGQGTYVAESKAEAESFKTRAVHFGAVIVKEGVTW